ncbi:hypothetical protein EHS17_02275 [Rhodobacteraceae bacterium CH30]|nr:hypothetical protein EHS17_02275 [Rhodobacteraceae bacterium CH30]
MLTWKQVSGSPLRTEQQYVNWVRRFLRFHHHRHPREMGATEVSSFLTHLAVEGQLSASTQNQALSALLFLYRDVLMLSLPWLDEVVRAKPSKHLPVILTRQVVSPNPSVKGTGASLPGMGDWRMNGLLRQQ